MKLDKSGNPREEIFSPQTRNNLTLSVLATAVLFTTVGMLFPTAAVAAETGGRVTAEEFAFSYKSSDLQDTGRAQSLLARIRSAARNNCPRSSLVPFRTRKICRNEIAAGLRAQIKSPLLDRLAAGLPAKLATAR